MENEKYFSGNVDLKKDVTQNRMIINDQMAQQLMPVIAALLGKAK
jgi:hypothetical protein